MIGGVTRRGSSPVFVGRARRARQLDGRFGRASAGQPSLVLVAGEAGVGKSRLIAEFSRGREAPARGDRGGCLDLGEGGLPYAPFVEALRGSPGASIPRTREAVFGPAADALGPLIPDLTEAAGRRRMTIADAAGDWRACSTLSSPSSVGRRATSRSS